MEISTSLAAIAILISALSAYYARRATLYSQRANQINVNQTLRQDRLAVKNIITDFLHFCTTYKTLQPVDDITTHELTNELDEFRKRINRYCPLEMPEVEKLIENIKKRVNQFQRDLDNLNAPGVEPVNEAYIELDDKIDAAIEWFAKKEKQINEISEPYLTISHLS